MNAYEPLNYWRNPNGMTAATVRHLLEMSDSIPRMTLNLNLGEHETSIIRLLSSGKAMTIREIWESGTVRLCKEVIRAKCKELVRYGYLNERSMKRAGMSAALVYEINALGGKGMPIKAQWYDRYVDALVEIGKPASTQEIAKVACSAQSSASDFVRKKADILIKKVEKRGHFAVNLYSLTDGFLKGIKQ
jgi:hypothetical protein